MKHKLSIIRVIFLAIAFGASYTASAQYMQRFDISDSNRLQKVTPLDVDNDGLIDIVKRRSDGGMYWQRNMGGNRFGAEFFIAYNTYSSSKALKVDLDGDGYEDLVVRDINFNGIVIHYNQGNGSFVREESILVDETSGFLFAFGDVDSDGKIDIVAVGRGIIGNTFWCKNLGHRNFRAPSILAGSDSIGDCYDIAVFDYNYDGKQDIVTTTSGGGCVRVYPNRGNGQFGYPIAQGPNGTGQFEIEIADVNTDGKADMLVFKNEGAEPPYTYLSNLLGGYWSNCASFSLILYALAFEGTDSDQDGDQDFIIPTVEGYLILVKNLGLNISNQCVNTQMTIIDSSNTINLHRYYVNTTALADYDNDGDEDIVLSGYGGPNNLFFYENLSTQNVTRSNTEVKLEARLYPNPSLGSITMSGGKVNLVGGSYRITDISGKAVLNGEIIQQDQKISLPLSPGVYVVHIAMQGKFTHQKVILR